MRSASQAPACRLLARSTDNNFRVRPLLGAGLVEESLGFRVEGQNKYAIDLEGLCPWGPGPVSYGLVSRVGSWSVALGTCGGLLRSLGPVRVPRESLGVS